MPAINLNEIIYLAPEAGQKEPAARLPDGSLVFVRRVNDDELDKLYALTQSEITPSVAPLDVVKAVHQHNPDSFWGVYSASDHTRADAHITGYYAFLHLNEFGLAALEAGKFDPLNPNLAQLVEAGQRPAVMYVWAILARRVARITTPLIAMALGKKCYGGVPMYTTAATRDGLGAAKGYGFVGAAPDRQGVGGLFRFDSQDGQATKPAA